MGIYMIVLHWLDYRRKKIQYIYIVGKRSTDLRWPMMEWNHDEAKVTHRIGKVLRG